MSKPTVAVKNKKTAPIYVAGVWIQPGEVVSVPVPEQNRAVAHYIATGALEKSEIPTRVVPSKKRSTAAKKSEPVKKTVAVEDSVEVVSAPVETTATLKKSAPAKKRRRSTRKKSSESPTSSEE